MTLQDKLYKLRREKGYSQEELAEKLDVSRQAVSKWERGESSPEINNIIAIAKLYDISVDELAGCIRGDESVKINGEPRGISLKKSSCAENAGIADDFIRMSIDKGSADEVYPNGKSAQEENIPQQDIMPKTYSQNGSCQKNSSYTYSDSYVHNHTDTQEKKKKRFRVFGSNPPICPSPQKAERCRKLKKFPFWALMVFLFFFFGGMLSMFAWSWIFFLFIPLYYSAVSAYERSNMNYFCYPVLAVICFFGTLFIDSVIFWGAGGLSAIGAIFWFLSIPLYYTAIAAYRHRKCKYFCFPVLIVMIWLISGLVYSSLFYKFIWLFAFIPFYYVYSSSIDKRVFGKSK